MPSAALCQIPLSSPTDISLCSDHFQLLEILFILNHCLMSGSKLSGPSLPNQPSCCSEIGGKGPLPSLSDLVRFHPPWVAPALQVVSMEMACPSLPSPSFLHWCSDSRWTPLLLRSPSERYTLSPIRPCQWPKPLTLWRVPSLEGSLHGP